MILLDLFEAAKNNSCKSIVYPSYPRFPLPWIQPTSDRKMLENKEHSRKSHKRKTCQGEYLYNIHYTF